jgi:bidirectional [NiFe] hydrogenase diaphorase subunit
MTATKPSTSTAHPSGDKRFKLLDRAINLHQGDGHALIEVLHTAQNVFGFLEDDILLYVARALKRPLSQVYGVATFYHYFRLKPPGEHTFVLCLGTACYVKGARQLQGAIEHRCGARFGETTRDGKVSLLTARCIGSCGVAPLAVLDEQVAPRLNEAEALARLDRW